MPTLNVYSSRRFNRALCVLASTPPALIPEPPHPKLFTLRSLSIALTPHHMLTSLSRSTCTAAAPARAPRLEDCSTAWPLQNLHSRHLGSFFSAVRVSATVLSEHFSSSGEDTETPRHVVNQGPAHNGQGLVLPALPLQHSHGCPSKQAFH